jgi:hypothetical protein
MQTRPKASPQPGLGLAKDQAHDETERMVPSAPRKEEGRPPRTRKAMSSSTHRKQQLANRRTTPSLSPCALPTILARVTASTKCEDHLSQAHFCCTSDLAAPPPDGSLKRKGAKPKGGGERGGKGGEQEEEGGDRPVQASYGLRVGGTSHTKCNVSTDSAPWDHPSV